MFPDIHYKHTIQNAKCSIWCQIPYPKCWRQQVRHSNKEIRQASTPNIHFRCFVAGQFCCEFNHFSGVQSTSLKIWWSTKRETNTRFEQAAPLAERPSKGFHRIRPYSHCFGSITYKMLNICSFCVHCKTYSFYRQYTVPRASSGHQSGPFFFLLSSPSFSHFWMVFNSNTSARNSYQSSIVTHPVKYLYHFHFWTCV